MLSRPERDKIVADNCLAMCKPLPCSGGAYEFELASGRVTDGLCKFATEPMRFRLYPNLTLIELPSHRPIRGFLP